MRPIGPFTAERTRAGYHHAADDEDVLGEFWAPIWREWRCIRELGLALGIGHGVVPTRDRERDAVTGLDYLRAAGSNGYDPRVGIDLKVSTDRNRRRGTERRVGAALNDLPVSAPALSAQPRSTCEADTAVAPTSLGTPSANNAAVRDALRVDAERAERVSDAVREDAAERLGFDAESLPERLEALDEPGRAWLVATLDRKMKEDDERGGPLLSLDD